MIYGYIRVSSEKKTVENQRFEINNFCERENIKIDGWIEETISGTKAYNKRQLGTLLRRVQKDDLIICAELSRLGRNLFMIMEILNICMTKECRMWTIKDNYKLGEDIQSKVLAFAFGLSAEIERNLISQRTKEALARKKAEGVILGRPKGKKNAPDKYKLSGKENLIRELLQVGVSKRKIAKICKVDRNTLSRFINDRIEAFNEEETIAWIQKQLQRYKDYGFGLWSVLLKDTDEMIGQCGITMQEYKTAQVPEIGYLLAHKYWHKGYAVEAATACREYGFNTLKFDELYSIIRDTNIASQKVALRNGMNPIDSIVKHYRGVDMPHLVYCVRKG